jgi:tungstate transport system permease protein
VSYFDREPWSIAWLSLRFSVTSVLIASLVGIPLGAWLGLARLRAKPLIAVVVHTGMALPPVVVGLALYLLLSRSGPLAALGWLFTPQAMITAQAILALPFVIGITMAAVAAVPPELEAQVRSLGATPRQARWAVLREARRGVESPADGPAGIACDSPEQLGVMLSVGLAAWEKYRRRRTGGGG